MAELAAGLDGGEVPLDGRPLAVAPGLPGGDLTGHRRQVGKATVQAQVHPGEPFNITALMYDYDALNSDDVAACKGNLWFGPYTDTELQAKKYVDDSLNRPIVMGYSGNGECFVNFHLS